MSDAWGRQNDTYNQCARNLNRWHGDLRADSLEANHLLQTLPLHTPAESVLPSLRSKPRSLSQQHAESLPGHFCDEGWDRAAWNQTLRENAEFIYKTEDHKSPTIGQRFQRIFYDFLWRLVNQTKSSIAVFRLSAVAVGENPPRAECDHSYAARSEFLLKS